MRKKKFMPDAKSWPRPAPVRLRDRGVALGLLQAIEPGGDEGELVAVIEGIAVLLPLELEGKLQGMIGQDVAVALMDGKWRAAVQSKRERRA